MGSGKSTYLYDKYRAYSRRGSKILAITHVLDMRKEGSMCTHTGLIIPAIKVNTLMEVDVADHDVILIDEGQFFPDLYEFVSSKMDEKIHIFVAGLSGDFRQARFGQVIDLIPMASECVHRTSVCDICGRDAAFTKRKAGNIDGQIDPGGFDKYYPVCHMHL